MKLVISNRKKNLKMHKRYLEQKVNVVLFLKEKLVKKNNNNAIKYANTHEISIVICIKEYLKILFRIFVPLSYWEKHYHE